jgi:predicted ATPase/class 3 adenylate cyclase
VTLLFADVEGSTRLLNLLGERFGPARARMRELVREAARAHDGAEVDWAGDGVFLAFASARDAVAAAARMHRSLSAEPWPDDEPHRLRIGLHTGEPELGPEGYVGIDVVIAARICSVAHGDQVVVSQATRDVSGDPPIADGSFRPLGRHRLKDVPQPAQLFQLVAPGLREEFPPLTTLTATNLPALHHRLVGREDALARVGELLERDGARLVTITGPGGAGKSRLALEVAAGAALDRPVHLVGLAPVTEAELVPNAIARALGVRESGTRQLLESVGDRLEGSGALLYLDNLEHLPGASVHVASLLDRVPDLQILATSRTPLRLSTERVLPLEPLSIEDATTLFVELAAARGVVLRPEALASVHEICRRLDGLPLAIELVAARLVVLPPTEIVRALEDGLALEMEGPIDLPERQRTLRAAIDWSYGRLTDSQRLLHGTIAVFSDSAALDDARALAPEPSTFLSDLEALVGWSLVRSETDDGTVRLSMLETVREHALGHLRELGALDDLRRRHAERLLTLALAAEAELAGEHQAEWLARLEVEFDNLGAALDWLLTAGRAEDALRATSALGRFWRSYGHVTEARRWLATGLELGVQLPSSVRADGLWTASRQASAQSDWDSATAHLEAALPLFREDGRTREVAFALAELAFLAIRRDELARGAELCEEALAAARAIDDPRAMSAALLTLAEIRSLQGRHTEALAHDEEAVALRRALGDPLLVTDAVHNLGWVAFLAGDHARSRAALEESLERARELGDTLHTAEALRLLGELDLLAGDLDAAAGRISDSLELVTAVGSDPDRAACLTALGCVAAARGDAEGAAALFAEADALRGDAAPEAPEQALLEHFVPSVSGTRAEK